MAAPPVTAAARAGLAARLDGLRDATLALWNETTPTLPPLGPRTSRWERFGNRRAAHRLIDELADELAAAPADAAGQRAWRASVRDRLLDFGKRRLAWP